MSEPIKSRRGVYFDLTKSPYVSKSPYGDLFRFSSRKKQEIFDRDIVKEVERVNKFMQRNNLESFIPTEIQELIRRKVYSSFYKKIEG